MLPSIEFFVLSAFLSLKLSPAEGPFFEMLHVSESNCYIPKREKKRNL